MPVATNHHQATPPPRTSLTSPESGSRSVAIASAAAFILAGAFFTTLDAIAPRDWLWTVPVAFANLAVVVLIAHRLGHQRGTHLVLRSLALVAAGFAMLAVAAEMTLVVSLLIVLLAS